MDIDHDQITSIERISLRPHDVIVVTVNAILSAQTAEHIRDTMSDYFSGHRIVVLDGSVKLSVFEPAACMPSA